MEFLKTVLNLKTRDFSNLGTRPFAVGLVPRLGFQYQHKGQEVWTFQNKGVTSTDLLQSNLLLIGEISSHRYGKLGVPKYLYLVRIIPVMPQ